MDENWESAKKHLALDGRKVRSKNEVIICNLLISMQIDFEYERELAGADGSSITPDFTFETAGGLIVWEHYGLMLDENYAARKTKKEKWLKDNGYIKGVNYFSTFSDTDGAVESDTFIPLCKLISQKMSGKVSYDEHCAISYGNSGANDSELNAILAEIEAVRGDLENLDAEEALQKKREEARRQLSKLQKELRSRNELHEAAAAAKLTVEAYAAQKKNLEAAKGKRAEVEAATSAVDALSARIVLLHVDIASLEKQVKDAFGGATRNQGIRELRAKSKQLAELEAEKSLLLSELSRKKAEYTKLVS